MRKIIFDVIILIVVLTSIIYVYKAYGDQAYDFLFGEQHVTMYIKSIPMSVSVADESGEHKIGLSGESSLREFEGKLFIFSKEDYYAMWMKDMLMSLDIIWINNNLEIVHIEKNVSPDTYPDSFVSEVPARFVLEVNSFFTDSMSVEVGDKVSLPPSEVPRDLIKLLQ